MTKMRNDDPPEPFTTHRPKTSLLIPSKRPLCTPSAHRLPATSGTAPALSIRSAASNDKDGDDLERKRAVEVEVDFSAAPQPFLDPVAWERVKR